MDFRLVNAIVYNGLSFYSANLGVNSYLGFFISAAVEVPTNCMIITLNQ